jgi:hypothetical protein
MPKYSTIVVMSLIIVVSGPEVTAGSTLALAKAIERYVDARV